MKTVITPMVLPCYCEHSLEKYVTIMIRHRVHLKKISVIRVDNFALNATIAKKKEFYQPPSFSNGEVRAATESSVPPRDGVSVSVGARF